MQETYHIVAMWVGKIVSKDIKAYSKDEASKQVLNLDHMVPICYSVEKRTNHEK